MERCKCALCVWFMNRSIYSDHKILDILTKKFSMTPDEASDYLTHWGTCLPPLYKPAKEMTIDETESKSILDRLGIRPKETIMNLTAMDLASVIWDTIRDYFDPEGPGASDWFNDDTPYEMLDKHGKAIYNWLIARGSVYSWDTQTEQDIIEYLSEHEKEWWQG